MSNVSMHPKPIPITPQTGQPGWDGRAAAVAVPEGEAAEVEGKWSRCVRKKRLDWIV
jgi:hypothetical protein